MIKHFPVLIIVSPLTVAFLGLVFRKNIIQLSVTGIFASLFFLLNLTSRILNGNTITYYLGDWKGPLGISLVIDGLSFFFSLIVLCAGLSVILYSLFEKKYSTTYYFFLLIALSSMLGIIFTGDIFNMYIFYELLTIATYLLIAYSKKGEALRASFNYLIMGGVGLSLFLFGIGFLYALIGTLDMSLMARQLPAAFVSSRQMVIISLVLLVTGMGIKVAIFPLHGWLPDAHSLAPSSVSALLSGITVKVGIYCMIRLVYDIFSGEKYLYMNNQKILMVSGVITLLFGAAMALAQTDLKRLLAYSTISQLGIIIVGLGIGTATGLNGAIFHVLNHVILKTTLFFCAGIIIMKTGSRKIQELDDFGRQEPLIALSFIIASLGMIGIPPVNGFISKFLICLAAIEEGYPLLVVIILIASIITAAYYFRIIQIFFRGSKKQNNIIAEIKVKEVLEKKYFGVWPIYILVGLSLLLGIIPNLGIKLVKPATMLLLSGVAR